MLFTGAKHSMFIPACSRSRNQTKWPNGIEMTHNSNSHRFSSWVRPKIFLFIGIHHTHDRMPYTRQCYALRYLLRYEYGYYTAVPMHCDSGFIQFSVSSGSQWTRCVVCVCAWARLEVDMRRSTRVHLFAATDNDCGNSTHWKHVRRMKEKVSTWMVILAWFPVGCRTCVCNGLHRPCGRRITFVHA